MVESVINVVPSMDAGHSTAFFKFRIITLSLESNKLINTAVQQTTEVRITVAQISGFRPIHRLTMKGIKPVMPFSKPIRAVFIYKFPAHGPKLK